MAAAANQITAIHQLAAALSPAELEQLKLARLRELRSAIDALRGELATRDPLIAWAMEQEANSPPDLS